MTKHHVSITLADHDGRWNFTVTSGDGRVSSGTAPTQELAVEFALQLAADFAMSVAA